MEKQHVDTQTVADWYDARYVTGQEQTFGRPPYESVLRLSRLPSRENMRVLDVGSGQGYFLHAVHDAGHSPVGIDISPEALHVSNKVSPESPVYIASGQNLPFPDEYFDVVAFWGTLEHHPDMLQALRECLRVLKQDGQVILRVPNSRFWVYRILSFLGMEPGTNQQDMIEQLLSMDEWKALCEQVGLEVISTQIDDWFLKQNFKTASGLPGKIKLALRKFSLAVVPLNLTYCFDFVCKPK